VAAHNELGKWGEDLAASFLEGKGYKILERDWKSGRQDLDIIAKEGSTVVIVEVKTRRNRLFANPEEAIDYKKRANLLKAINHYTKSHPGSSSLRFDVISIVGTPDSKPEIDHIMDVKLY